MHAGAESEDVHEGDRPEVAAGGVIAVVTLSVPGLRVLVFGYGAAMDEQDSRLPFPVRTR